MWQTWWGSRAGAKKPFYVCNRLMKQEVTEREKNMEYVPLCSNPNILIMIYIHVLVPSHVPHVHNVTAPPRIFKLTVFFLGWTVNTSSTILRRPAWMYFEYSIITQQTCLNLFF